MKLKILLTSFLIICFFLFSNAQGKKNSLKCNILSPIFHTANFSYERAVSHKVSLQTTGFYNFARPFSEFFGFHDKVSIYSLSLDGRYYLNGNVFNGLYMSPFFRFQKGFTINMDGEDRVSYGVRTNFNLKEVGIVFGSQSLVKRITFDFFAGPFYVHSSNNTGYFNQSGFGLRGGINVGFAF